MTSVNMHEAKTHLSRLVAKVQAGEEVVISKAGKPVARLVGIQPKKRKRSKFGFMKGQIWTSPDFDAPDPELEALFNDGPVFPSLSEESAR